MENKIEINKVFDGVKVKQRSYTVNEYTIIEYNDSYFIVMKILSKKEIYYLVFDYGNLDIVKNFKIDETKGNWNLTNNYVTFSKKRNGKCIYLHNMISGIEPNGSGKDSIDHLNRIKLDNRLVNLKTKSQSKQNENQDTRKCGSKSLELIPESQREYYLKNRKKFIYWLYSNTHGHRIYAGPVGDKIKERKFSSKDPTKIPELMRKAENYLYEEAKKYNMDLNKYTSALDNKSEILKKEYEDIVQSAKIIFEK